MPPDTATTAAPDIGTTVDQILKLPFSWEKLLYTVLILAACIVVMKVLTALVQHAIHGLGVEKSLHTFLKSVLRIFMWLVTIIIVLSYIGVDPTSLIAILSVAGLAVSLAIQGTLSNLAGGIMILISKPFKVGEYIQAGGVEGTVADIALVYTRIKTFDNKLIFIPNGEIAKEKIINYTSQEERRVDLKFTTAYQDDPKVVIASIQEVIGRNAKIHAAPPPFVRTSDYKESSVEYTVRVWCATADYWEVYFDLIEQVREAFHAAGVEMTYNHLNVHIIE